MKAHNVFLLGIVFTLAIGLAFPKVSIACWFTGENTYECCTFCCQDEQACYQFLHGDRRTSGCTFNYYCLVNPFYCFVTVCADRLDICPFRPILNDDPAKLDVLREIRDTRLFKTDLGESLVDLFYQQAGEVTAILRADDDLLVLSANITDEIVERALEADGDEEIIIDRELVESALKVMDVISEEAGPELRRTIRLLQREMKRKEFFSKLGITISE